MHEIFAVVDSSTNVKHHRWVICRHSGSVVSELKTRSCIIRHSAVMARCNAGDGTTQYTQYDICRFQRVIKHLKCEPRSYGFRQSSELVTLQWLYPH